jgi:adenylate cyclase
MAEARVERRLAAILAADVAGYSRLMCADEVGTLAALKAHRREIVDPAIAQHHGRIVKTTGDGMLVEFASAVDAVTCAVAVQEKMAERTAEGTGPRIQFRVGINIGDIIIDGDDIFGDGVNLAARVENECEPGGVCLSGGAFDQVRGKTSLAFDDLGERSLKNIDRPVRLYTVRRSGAAAAKLSGETAAKPPLLSDKPSIAVLPFDNMSGDPEQQYFSDGLSEDIITLLSSWRSFPVIARNSSFAFGKQSRDIRTIGRELSARYVIEGSVRKSGNRVRITAQLIDADSGHHLWAKKFDGAYDDVFALQDEITRQIVSSVEPEMEKAELRKSEAKRSENLDAWDHFLRGRAFLYRLTPEDTVRARAMFERAIALDSQYSDAWAGLSWTYQREILFDVVEDRKAWEEQALKAARRAVALDEGSSFAHLALGGAFQWSNQHDQAIAETRMAVELNPSNVAAWLALGNRLDIIGQHEEGIALLEKCLRLNAHDPHNHIYYAQLGRAYINARKCEIALRYLRESIRIKPDHANTYHVLAICLGHLGRVNDACEAAQRCEQLRPGLMKRRAYWNIYLDPEANKHLTEGLRKAGLVG